MLQEPSKSKESPSSEPQSRPTNTVDINAQVGINRSSAGLIEPRSEVRIENIAGLPIFNSGTATTAPTHSPRNFWESIVLKDDGVNRYLWIYCNNNWRYLTLT